MLIINADDWGRDSNTTDRIRECVQCGAVSSVSAMVFMEDSKRAALIARDAGILAGLHLNFTTAFTFPSQSPNLRKHQARVSAFLLRSPIAQAFFHPGLADSFAYLVRAQCEEYANLYGTPPERLDGHHHMHLCANVLFQRLLPSGAMVRKSFSFRRGEKSVWNLTYRRLIDAMLRRNHLVSDYFFSLAPLEPRERLGYISSMAADYFVEVETHPALVDEYNFLTSDEIFRYFPRHDKSSNLTKTSMSAK